MRKLKVDYIPAEKLWEVYWVAMGQARSLKKLSRWCANNGIINPVSQRQPTPDGCRKAMWRWAVRKENRDVAYKILNDALANEGDYCSKEEFLLLCTENSKSAYQSTTGKKRERFLKTHGLPIPQNQA
jgi:hypothetical protein